MDEKKHILQSQVLPISLIDPNNGQIPGVPKNPRKRDDEQLDKLVRSLREDPEMTGMRELLVVRVGERYVALGGNMRLEAMKLMGEKEAIVKVLPAGLDPKKLQAIAIKDNNSFGSWDFELLQLEWDPADLENWGCDFGWEGAGFDESGQEPGSGEPREAKEDDFDEDTADIATRVKLGDIWQLGNHRLMCGDSTDVNTVKKLMDGELADLWLTDPPYNVALGYEGSETEKMALHRRTDCKVVINDSMPDKEFRKFLISANTAACECMKPGASFYMFHADSEGYNFRGSIIDTEGLTARQALIWAKDQLCMGRQDYQWRHEPCLYGWKDGAAHKWYTDRKQTTVMEFARPKRSEEHPTMKPLPLFGYLMGNSTKEGDIVLDTFGGSGTTLICAEQMLRRCYMMELSEQYADVIIARWETLTGLEAKLIHRENKEEPGLFGDDDL